MPERPRCAIETPGLVLARRTSNLSDSRSIAASGRCLTGPDRRALRVHDQLRDLGFVDGTVPLVVELDFDTHDHAPSGSWQPSRSSPPYSPTSGRTSMWRPFTIMFTCEGPLPVLLRRYPREPAAAPAARRTCGFAGRRAWPVSGAETLGRLWWRRAEGAAVAGIDSAAAAPTSRAATRASRLPSSALAGAAGASAAATVTDAPLTNFTYPSPTATASAKTMTKNRAVGREDDPADSVDHREQPAEQQAVGDHRELLAPHERDAHHDRGEHDEDDVVSRRPTPA